MSAAFIALLGLAAVMSPAVAAPVPQASADVTVPVSPTPPMGWSSWSALREGSGLTQDGIKAQARAMHDKLRRYGYRYINPDSGWSDHLDAYGRSAWDTSRFPDGIPAFAAPGSLETGRQTTVTTDFTNWGTTAATDVRVALPVAKGWTAAPVPPASFASVATGATVRVTSVLLDAPAQAPFHTFGSTPEPANFSQTGHALGILAAGGDVYGSKK